MKKNALNLAANLSGFVVTFGVSFFLSPYIVRTLGVEANGLIGLTSNVSNYGNILTIMMTSMAARFVTVELSSERPDTASEFYTATYANNLLSAVVLLPVMVLTVMNFGAWFNVPERLVGDAQLLAALYFMNSLLQLLVPRWSIGTWATNNLYLDSLRTMQSVLIRACLILALFLLFEPAVYFVGIATLVAGTFALAFSAYYKHRLLPHVQARFSLLRWRRMWALLAAGFWNTINYLGSLLTTGFHLLLAATFLGATPMGLLALAITVPAMAHQLALNLTTLFLPRLTYAYAAGDSDSMRRRTKRAMSITALLAMQPFAVLAVYGETFFGLWVPSEDATTLYWIAVAAAAALAVSALTQPLQNVFIATNSQRSHSVASLVVGVLNIAMAITLLLTTDLGVFAILLAAAVTTVAKACFLTTAMAARRLRGSTAELLAELARGLGYLTMTALVGFAMRVIQAPASWLGFFVGAGLMCALGTALGVLLLSAPADRRMTITATKGVLASLSHRRGS